MKTSAGSKSAASLFGLLGLAAIFILGLYACSPTSSEGYQPNFLNQPLQGKINGKPWTFAAGNVSRSSYDTSFEFNLVDTVQGGDTCTLFSAGTSGKILFSVHKGRAVLDTGTYRLKFDFGGDYATTQTVTFYFLDSEGVSQNMVATEGAFRITEADTAAGMQVVRGMMDVRFNDKNYVNGSFELKYCP